MDVQAFLENPLIEALAKEEAWSISDKDKRPLDIFELEVFHRVIGCRPDMPGATVTLDHLLRLAPTPPNLAFFLNADLQGYVCLDVEKTCDEDLKRRFRAMPFIYGETSLSGKGLHLWFPMPTNIGGFPDARHKIKLREPRGNYELLMRSHWVTFTGNQIERAEPPDGEEPLTIEDVYAELALHTPKPVVALTGGIDDICSDISQIPDIDYIMGLLLDTNPFDRVPEDFPDDNNAARCDMSRYEYAYIASRYRLLRMILKLSRIEENGHVYTVDERWAILLECAVSFLEHREKHDELRCGMPYLVYNTRSILMRVMEQGEVDEIEAALAAQRDDLDGSDVPDTPDTTTDTERNEND